MPPNCPTDPPSGQQAGGLSIGRCCFDNSKRTARGIERRVRQVIIWQTLEQEAGGAYHSRCPAIPQSCDATIRASDVRVQQLLRQNGSMNSCGKANAADFQATIERTTERLVEGYFSAQTKQTYACPSASFLTVSFVSASKVTSTRARCFNDTRWPSTSVNVFTIRISRKRSSASGIVISTVSLR